MTFNFQPIPASTLISSELHFSLLFTSMEEKIKGWIVAAERRSWWLPKGRVKPLSTLSYTPRFLFGLHTNYFLRLQCLFSSYG